MKMNCVLKNRIETRKENTMRIRYFLVLLAILFIKADVWAFDDAVTHREIVRRVIPVSNIKTYLKEELGFSNDIGEELDGKPISEWLEYGSEMEDAEDICRASNHFHNPALPWYQAGLSDTWWVATGRCLLSNYQHNARISDLTWATGYLSNNSGDLDNEVVEENEWDWDSAKEYFYIYLTGKDFEGSEVATDDESRKENLAKCMRALGQVMHLLQDMAVPAHVRNDFSQGHLMHIPEYESFPWRGNRFEGYVKANNRREWFNRNPIKCPLSAPRLTDFWDTTYTEGTNLASPLGLSEYTQINFLSEYTMFTDDFPYPSSEDCVIEYNPAFGNLPDLDRQYISSTNGHPGDPVAHLAVVSYLDYFHRVYFPNINSVKLPLSMDENCYNEYASKLIPRAIGYSADLLDYFFRGEVAGTCVPIIDGNTINKYSVYVKNMTQTQEPISDGHFSLVVYTPEDENPRAGMDIYILSDEKPSGELPYGQVTNYQFTLSEPMATEDLGSVQCMLVFKGKLGNEEDVVIGKSLPAGKAKFFEEWDNGLQGNYPWYHSTAEQNYNNGTTSNVIENGVLEKDNVRFINQKTRRINQSFIYYIDLGSECQVVDSNSPNGILITPNTFLQFKIDDLFINQQPPAPPGYTTAYQYFQMEFNALIDGQPMYDYLALEFTQPGQAVNQPGITEVPYSFPLGEINNVNIYSLFQRRGITIPEPFYLQCVELNQQLENLGQPSTIEHHQHMEVDFISIVEANNESVVKLQTIPNDCGQIWRDHNLVVPVEAEPDLNLIQTVPLAMDTP
jgi:hypothetical protein